jgi:hypothetical protein
MRLNMVEYKEQYHVEVSDRFSASENLDTKMDVNSVWKTITENIKVSAIESLGYDLKKHKSRFHER